jgi:hypothetical protein
VTASADTLQRVASFLGDALRPFVSSLGSDGEVLSFVEELGWSLPLVPPSIPALGTGGNAVVDALADVEIATTAFAEGTGDGDAVTRALVDLVAKLGAFALQTRELRTKLAQELPPDVVAATGIADAFQKRLFEDLVVRAISARAPLGTAIAGLPGIVEEVEVEADATRFQPDYTRRTLRLDRIGPLLNDPRSLLQDVYGWGTPTLDLDRLFTNIERVSYPLLGPIELRYPSDQLLASTAPGAPISPDDGPPPAYTIPIYEGGPITIVLAVLPLPKLTPQELQGVAITLALQLEEETGLALGPLLTLTLDGTLDLSSGVAVVLRPDRDPTIALSPEGTPAPLTGKGGARFSFSDSDGQATRLLTIPGGSFFEATELYFAAGVDATAGPPDVYIEAGAKGGTLTIAASDADSFLVSILPKDGLTTHFDFGVEWSHRGGLRFSGGAHLDTTIPLNITLGPFTVQSTHVELTADGNGVTLELSASARAMIGPINASVDRLGIILQSAFSDGNLGPVDLVLGFKPPNGAGLSIDAAGVTGGGFLKYDGPAREYSGVLQLQFNDLALQAFGLITTQVAGRAGYSLLALIDADFPPVQLGWGFTLDGVGGLLALNRAASTDALHAALKANTLSSILFPKNAITNAPQILSTLDAIFPIAPGRFLFGPMALIGWGTPTLLTAAIAVIVELPEPIRIVLIARLSAKLPSESEALVRINMDALGILDFSQDSLSLDAALFDSKLLTYTLSGSMALRANWSSSSQREFLLAIGGVHPQFSPPAGFPALQRITIDMPSGPVSKLRLAAYLAISSNTVQFGATLDVFIGVSGFGLLGHLGFDALLQLDPFHFDADISGQVALTAGGDDLMSVGLDATLSGPAPCHIAGQFKIHVVFFDVHISFSYSWGDDAPDPQIAPVQVLPLLQAALADARNWGGALPAGTPPLVSLKDTGSPVLHPLARLEVHESVVPLGLAITHFGSAPAAGATTFTIGDYQVNGSAVDHEAIQDDFAPAQFFDLSDDEKLARPSFERQDAGVRLTGIGLTKCGAPVSKTIAYETFYVDQPGGPLRTDSGMPPKVFGLGDLALVIAIGASGQAAIRSAGNRKYTAPGTPVQIAPQSFVIADRTNLALAGVGASTGSTYSEAAASLKSALAENPAQRAALQIISSHELVTA